MGMGWDMMEANKTTAFDAAIQAIIDGATKLRRLTENDGENQTYPDDDSSFTKISNGAFCLRLAYKIWADLRMDECLNGIPSVAKRKMTGGPPAVAVAVTPAMTKEDCLHALITNSDLTPDELDEFAKLFRKQYEATMCQLDATD